MNKLRTIPASAEEQSLKFSHNYSIKLHFASFIFTNNCSSQMCVCASTNEISLSILNELAY